MNEINNEEQYQKPKTSKLSIASLVLSVVTPFFMLPLLSTIHPASKWDNLFRNIAFLLPLVILILGISALIQIKRSTSALRGHIFAIISIPLSSMFLGLWISQQLFYDITGQQHPCTMNLNSLGKAMIIYASENKDKYPTADKWCDLLLEHTDVSVEQFVCPSFVLYRPLVGGEMFVWPIPKKGRCNYAMNPNCKLNSPPDVVLLFETKAGWNQVWGPEILTTDHHQGKGCNVLFNDTHVKFVNPEGLKDLKWKPEETKNE